MQEGNLQKKERFEVPTADIIITNARLLTMHKPAMRADSLAIKDNRIIAVGSNADVKALKDKHTRVVDAQMNTVMPGIIESHIHLFGGAVELDSLMINNIKGLAPVSDSIREYAKANPKDQHGNTSHLTQQEREELIAFLKALPYETPPDETPNTVPWRIKLK